MKRSGIYKITNVENGKVYIGSSVDINRRWWEHRSRLKYKRHGNDHLLSAWSKYGKEKFHFCIIEECLKDHFKERESYWIRHYNSDNREFGYNKSIPDTPESFIKDSRTPILKKGRGKKITCINKETGEEMEYNSVAHAAKELNIPQRKIYRVTGYYRGKRGDDYRASYRGYVFRLK